LFNTVPFWFSIIIIPPVALSKDFIWAFIKRNYYPESYHIVQEIETRSKTSNYLLSDSDLFSKEDGWDEYDVRRR